MAEAQRRGGDTAAAGQGPAPTQAQASSQLLTAALDEVSRGRLESAQQLLEAHGHLGISLGDVFRSYQAELESRAQQLAEGQRRLERTLDWFTQLHRSLPVAALLVNAHGLVVDANACAIEQFALRKPQRSMQLPLRRLLAHAEDEVHLTRLRRQLDETEQAAMDDLALRTLDGQPRWADVRMTRLPAGDVPWGPGPVRAGQLDLLVLTDRTARVEAQHAREAAAAAEHRRL